MISEKDVQTYQHDGVIVVPEVLGTDTLSQVRSVIAELVAGSAKTLEHTDVYDLEPGHTAESPRVRRIKAPHKVHKIFDEIVRSEPGKCPICGMKLVPMEADAPVPATHAHTHDTGDGLEWEDLMPEINKASVPCNMIWKLVDRDTGKANWDIDWAFRVGDRVKIRLVNTLDSDHPMHHPFHIHGAGRFVVLTRDGVPNQNIVWKDTVLLRSGETVDILLDVTNPGLWMAHCHIAEHNQNGMMFSFPVEQEA